MMNKYRICPDCGSHNPPGRIECSECEADLTSVPVVDESTAERSPIVPPKPMVRICSCGTKNPAAMRKCASCGEDISDVMPSSDEEEAATRFTLASVDGEYAYEITQTEITVGREQELREYLAAKPFVSRIHARFTTEDGRLFITNLSATNFTYVNNVRISERQELHDGDEIGLGGTSVGGNRQSGAAYFTVRICK